MFYNGAKCDIYIGKGAGKKLLSDIRNAKHSIKIVSPYLSPSLIAELINLRKKDLEIELITTDNLEDFYENREKNILKLIVQNRKTDKQTVEKREQWKDIVKILTYIGIGIILVLGGLVYYIRNEKLIFGLIPLLIVFLIIRLYRKKIKNKRIFSYSYSQLFPFKVYMSPDRSKESNTFIHSKIYLIDERVAYLGSLNFTASGTKYNYETRVRTEEIDAIEKIKEEIHQLMHYSNLPEKNIQAWGKQLYSEPIN